MTQRKFIYVHKRQQGDVLIWDNCLTIHQGIGNYRLPQRRLLYRTMIRGGAPY